MSAPAPCPCTSGKDFEACCGPWLGGKPAPTAEALMRSRYTAYTKADIAYLRETLAPKERKSFEAAASEDWARHSEWLGLEIHGTEKGQPGDNEGLVEFTARFTYKGKPGEQRERARFTFNGEAGRWQYAGTAVAAPAVRAEVPGRNDPCACGSGRKYKKCCGAAA